METCVGSQAGERLRIAVQCLSDSDRCLSQLLAEKDVTRFVLALRDKFFIAICQSTGIYIYFI